MVCLKTKLLVSTASILLLLAFSGEPRQLSAAGDAVPTPSTATRKPTKAPELSFILDKWDSLVGLPQNSVVGLAQTSDGYLWIGTQEGVTRFDGVNFKTYRDTSDWAGGDIFISALLAAKDRSVWVATRGGLNNIKGDVFTTYTEKSGLPNQYVTSLAVDASGNLWIGTRKGLARLNDGKITPFALSSELKDSEITAILPSREGSLWIGVGKKLVRYKNGSLKTYSADDGLTGTKVTRLFEDSAGNLWIGTYSGGLYRFKNDALVALTTREGLSHDFIHSLAQDKTGRIWIGTNQGLDYLEEGRLSNYAKYDKSFTDQIISVYPDSEGSIWVGTNSNGLMRLRKSKFVVYGSPEGLAKDDTWCTLEARDGSIWIGLGAGGGLAKLKNGKIQSWSTHNGLPDSEVLSLFEDSDGSIWVGTGKGICNLKNGKFKCYSANDGLTTDVVTAIAKSRDGSLWIGTDSGISRFKDGAFDNSWNDRGLRGNLIADLMISKEGVVWIAGMPDGLFRIKENRISKFTTADGLSSNQTTAIYEDLIGDLWVGTYQNGLNRIRKDGKVSSYTVRDGLIENQVFDTLEDDFGNFWLTSNHGIFRIAKRQFDEFDQGLIKQLTPVRYGISDGLRTEECNGGSQPSSWKTRDGKLLITTIKGLVTFDPATISTDSFFPPVIIEQVIANREPVAGSSHISLGPDLRDLEIQYTGLSLLAPTKIHFKYKLEGYDTDWKSAGLRRTAFYTNLPPGDFRFRVIASNAAGLWNESGAQLNIKVQKVFYQKAWFYLLCSFVIGLAIYAAHRFRISRSNERLLDKIAMSLPIAMSVIDNKSNVKMLNNQFVKDFGYTIKDLTDLDEWFKKVYPDRELRRKATVNWEKAMSATSLAELRSVQKEWHITCKDGSERDVEVRIARALDRMIVTLNDITFQKQAEEALKTQHEQLRELAARLQQAREEERAFIAREIHDELGQLLTGLKMDIKWVEKRLPSNVENASMFKDKLVSILELVDDTIVALRRIATELRPGVLDTLGLNAAIEWQAREFSNRTGIDCEISEQTNYQVDDRNCESALFRIFQEALTNVARHADASQVRISLSRQNGSLILQIRDNGRGITEKEIKDPHSIGLLGMRERAHVFGGEVNVSGAPGRGTTVTASIPLETLHDIKHAESSNNGHAESSNNGHKVAI